MHPQEDNIIPFPVKRQSHTKRVWRSKDEQIEFELGTSRSHLSLTIWLTDAQGQWKSHHPYSCISLSQTEIESLRNFLNEQETLGMLQKGE